MSETCVCFPGMCRGGQVIDGKTASGKLCREAARERAESRVRLGLISVCEEWAMNGALRQFTMTRHYHDRDVSGIAVGGLAIAAMFDRIVELEALLAERDIPIPCNLRPSRDEEPDEQTDDCTGLPWSAEC